MTDAEAREIMVAALTAVAPETDAAALVGDVELAEQLDIDSMDFLSVVTEVCERTGIEIPERDYPRLRTLDDAAAYLVAA